MLSALRPLSPGLRLPLGLSLSLVCLYLAVWHIPLGELSSELREVRYWWLAPAGAAQLAALLTRALRWQVLLQGRAGLGELFWAQAIGFLGNNLLPLRAGEVGRTLVVSQRTGLPLLTVGASVVLERALDVASVLLMLACVLVVVPVPAAMLQAAVALLLALVAAAVVVFTLAAARGSPRHIPVIGTRLPEPITSSLAARWSEVRAGLATLGQGRTLGRLAGWSVLTWAASIGGYWSAIEAIAPGSFILEPALATAAVAIGISLPSSPGFVGVYELVGQQALLVPFPERYTAASALAVTLLAHLVYYTLTSLLGVVGLARLGLPLAALTGKPVAIPVRPAKVG